MIAQVLAYIRQGWRITSIRTNFSGKLQWVLATSLHNGIRTVAIPKGWVKPS